MKSIKILVATCVFFLINGLAFAQITFEKTYGETGEDEAFSGIQTPDGGYLAVGRTVTELENPGYVIQKDDEVCVGCDYNLIAIKTDEYGVVEWTTIFENQGWEWAESVINVQDGGFVIAGRTESIGAGDFDILLLKLNSDGEILWTNTFGGAEEDRGYSVAPDNDGGFLVCGRSKSFSGPWNAYLVKTDSAGQLVWQKSYGATTLTLGFYATRTADGGIIICGRTTTLDQTDGTLIKTDVDGILVWQNYYGGIYNDRAYQVVEKQDGGFVFCGSHANTNGTTTLLWVQEVDENGAETAQNLLYGTQGFQWAYEIQGIPNGYIVAGRTNSQDENAEFDMVLIKVNSALELQWSKTFGGAGEESGLAVDQTNDGGFLLTGWTRSYGDTDILLVKTDSLGQTCSFSFEQNFSLPACDPFTLYPVGSFDSLLWSDGSNGSNLYLDMPGSYSVIGFKEGCTVASETFELSFVAHPAIQLFDTSIYADCYGAFYDVLGTPGFDSYLWSNNDTNLQTKITFPSEVYLLETIAGCTYSTDSLTLYPDSTQSLNPVLNYISQDSAAISWNINTVSDFYEFEHRLQGANAWITTSQPATAVFLGGLECSSTYDFRIRANCSSSFSGFSSIQQFQTDICTSIAENVFNQGISIYPNPAKHEILIKMLDFSTIKEVKLFDSKGAKILVNSTVRNRETSLNLNKFQSGIYFLSIVTDKGVKSVKFSIE